MPDAYWQIRDFLEAGGNVLYAIMAVTFLMWSLIAERYWYRYAEYPGALRGVLETWTGRADRSSWYARQIRRQLASQIALSLQRSTGSIQALVTLCPLLGLLGTVIGMIDVFETMALQGSGNPRSMASGVMKATIPTMAGMVAALSGLYFSVRLERWTTLEAERVEDQLTLGDEHGA
jgi:biopolymer transport protein ExbB